ncbi:MAG: SIS domain-containing protein [Lentisphaeria bacterium]|nr:SIS domain-containing protein [Lentisphaeria bacterium]
MAEKSSVVVSLLERFPLLRSCEAQLYHVFDILVECFENKRKLLVCGNGGSAADAQHIAGELMKGFVLPRRVTAQERAELINGGENGEYLAEGLQRGIPVIPLVGMNALGTAVANDNGGDLVFAQQVFALGCEGDVLWGISTSGTARNVVLAAETARARGMMVVGMTGSGGGQLATLCDACIRVPKEETFLVQELHLPIYHALCIMLEASLFGGDQEDKS